MKINYSPKFSRSYRKLPNRIKDDFDKKHGSLRGIWEVGSWSITSKNGNKETCNLSVYAGSIECCFNARIVSNNLLLSSKHQTGITTQNVGADLCVNKVMVK